MQQLLLLVLFLFVGSHLMHSQVLHFNDLELKRYLVTETCVDTTQNGISFSKDRRVDTNGDGEVQLQEALSVEALELYDFRDNYGIRSLTDLNQFSNLEYLKIIALDSLTHITQLHLDSLQTLWISDGVGLKVIDISNLPNLTHTLRIEGITTLDTLNTRNGTHTQVFSLFYSFDIKYACIDSIAGEINEFIQAGAMLPGVAPSFNCELLSSHRWSDEAPSLTIYPIPADGYLTVETDYPSPTIQIFTLAGKVCLQSTNKHFDVSMLPPGLYLLRCHTGHRITTQKIVIQ